METLIFARFFEKMRKKAITFHLLVPGTSCLHFSMAQKCAGADGMVGVGGWLMDSSVYPLLCLSVKSDIMGQNSKISRFLTK